jgi:ferredoxin/flavodoxin
MRLNCCIRKETNMKIPCIKTIYFSPTETTEKVVKTIAEAINPEKIIDLNCTNYKNRKTLLSPFHNEIIIFGSPVYEGRLPHEVEDYFSTIKGENTYAILVVVYGGREYEDAALELRDITLRNGFIPTALGIFVGEHSFSSEVTPISINRPDLKDLDIAIKFGNMIKNKLINSKNEIVAGKITIPGKTPYRKRFVDRIKITPHVNKQKCSMCGNCAEICPNGAISQANGFIANKRKCIICCACVKKCPTKARKVQSFWVKIYCKVLYLECKKRKEPELYL